MIMIEQRKKVELWNKQNMLPPHTWFSSSKAEKDSARFGFSLRHPCFSTGIQDHYPSFARRSLQDVNLSPFLKVTMRQNSV